MVQPEALLLTKVKRKTEHRISSISPLSQRHVQGCSPPKPRLPSASKNIYRGWVAGWVWYTRPTRKYIQRLDTRIFQPTAKPCHRTPSPLPPLPATAKLKQLQKILRTDCHGTVCLPRRWCHKQVQARERGSIYRCPCHSAIAIRTPSPSANCWSDRTDDSVMPPTAPIYLPQVSASLHLSKRLHRLRPNKLMNATELAFLRSGRG